MTLEEFKALTLGEKVLLYAHRYRLSYFCEGCYIGCLKGNQGHIVNLTEEHLPFLKKGWHIDSAIIKKTTEQEIAELKDKLHRRNMQIKDLKKELQELKNLPLVRDTKLNR